MRERSALDTLAIAVGVTLVVIGAGLAIAQVFNVSVLAFAWPLVVIAPGLAFLVAAFSVPGGRGIGYLAVPGCVILATGIVLEAQTITGDWQSWSYAWPVIAPGAVGVGLLVAAARENAPGVRRAGTILVAIAALLLVAAEWFFVRVLGVGGPGLGRWFGFVLPVLVIALGIRVFVRGLASGR